MSALGDAAASYAERGWYVFPLKARGKTPLHAGGFRTATAEPEQVRAIWRKHPNANVGVHLGRSGLIVIDLDGPKARARAKDLGLLDRETLMVRTPGKAGRLHLYFRCPETMVVPNQGLSEGIDVRGSNGYVVLPPSIHSNGTASEWVDGLLIPRCLSDRELSLFKHRPADERARSTWGGLAGGAVPEGARSNYLADYAGKLFARGVSDEEALTLVRARNARHCVPPLSVQEVDHLVFSIGQSLKTKRTDSDPRVSELDTIHSLILVGAKAAIVVDPGRGVRVLSASAF
jgi:hypothetical protein